jgi:hypothetical protein
MNTACETVPRQLPEWQFRKSALLLKTAGKCGF